MNTPGSLGLGAGAGAGAGAGGPGFAGLSVDTARSGSGRTPRVKQSTAPTPNALDAPNIRPLAREDTLLAAKRSAISSYIVRALVIWAACIVCFLVTLGPGGAKVASVVRSVHLPDVATVHLVTLVAFAVVIWTDATSMFATRQPHKKVMFRLMLMINGLPFVTYTLILTGLAPARMDWFGHQVYIVRYIQWCFTTPALILLVSQLANEPTSVVAPTMIVDVVMVITGWLANCAPFWYIWFLISCTCFCHVMMHQWQLLGVAMSRAIHHSDVRGLKWVRAYTMAIWTVFPLAWLLAAFEVVSPQAAQLMISVCDIGAKLVHSSILRVGSFMSVDRVYVAKELIGEDVITNPEATDERLGQMTRLVTAAAAESKGHALSSSALSTLSHELRTPLNSIVGFNSMLLGAPIAAAEKQNVYAALQAAQKLEDVITNVVYYSDFERNGYPVAVEAEFGLETEVEAVVSKLAGAAIDHSVYVSVSVDTMCPSRVVGPRQHFGMILRNLVHNAIKFTLPGGHVQVECKMGTDKLPRPRNRELLGQKAGPTRRYLDVSVRDTGIGIGVKDQERVFRAFEQVAPAASGPGAVSGGSTPLARAASKLARAMTPRLGSKESAAPTVEALAPGLADGVGLGLTLSSVLVEGNNGSIKLTSAPGHGTTVVFRLPVGVVPDKPGAHSLRASLLRGRAVQLALLGEQGPVVSMHVEGVLTSLGVSATKARAKSAATVARLLKREPKPGTGTYFVIVNWAALGGTLESARTALEAAVVPVLLLASPLERALLRSDDGDDDASVESDGRGPVGTVADTLGRKQLVVSTPPFSQHRVFRSLALLARKAMRSASTVSLDTSLATSEDSASSLSDGEEVTDLTWLRVLIVDDTKVNRMVLSRIMKKLRIRVADTACNGREGVDMARDPNGRYDVILMDIMMPVMDGIEATKDLRTNPPENAPRPVIVAVTASDSVQQAQAAKEAGVDDQMLKPVRKDNMQRLLQRLVISGAIGRAHTFSPSAEAAAARSRHSKRHQALNDLQAASAASAALSALGSLAPPMRGPPTLAVASQSSDMGMRMRKPFAGM